MDRRDISKALFASAAGSALVSQPAAAQTCNAPCYAQTAAEIAAGVTPTNYTYPPGHVYRYGTNSVPGTTDMTNAINTAANVCRRGNYTLQLPSEVCLVSSSLNFTACYVTGTRSFNSSAYNIQASSAQFDVITTTGGTIMEEVAVHGGWDGATTGLSGDIFSATATAPAHPYVITLRDCQFAFAKKRAIYIERGGYTSFFHVACLTAGLHSLECFGTASDACTTIRDYGGSQFGSTPNGYGIKLTECTAMSFHGSILEGTRGISLNGSVNNEGLTFDGVYQENTIGGNFFTDNAGGKGLTIRGCYGGNTACPPFTLWQDIYFQGNTLLAQGALQLAGRVTSNSAGPSIISATGDVTAGSLTLAPGSYRLTGRVQTIISSGGGSITQLACQITTNASASGLANTTFPFVEGADQTQSFGPQQDGSVKVHTVIQLTSTTAVYLRAHIALSGAIVEGWNGILRAELIE
jgi:hypothetical protein